MPQMPKVIKLVVEGDEAGLRLCDSGVFAADGYVGKIERWVDVGDLVLVDPSAYFMPESADQHDGEPVVWSRVESISPGTAATFPVRVVFENRLSGQYKPAEVIAIKHVASLGAGAAAEYWR